MKEKSNISAQSEYGYELAPRLPDIPKEADFSLTITDESMHPYIRKGDRVYVQARSELEEFDVGLFLYEGQILCRQWCQDYSGKLHLLCANPAMERENIALDKDQQKKLSCLGKVLLKKRLTRPNYY